MARVVTTKYLPATNTRGARIKVTSWLGSKTYSYDHAAEDAHDSAFSEWLLALNKEMAVTLPDCQDAVELRWFKKVARGSLPDGRGYGYVVQ